jgi:hypothetical protein
MSWVAEAAREFSDEDTVDMAAARIPATSSPLSPAGQGLDDEEGEDLVGRVERTAA